MPWPLTQPGHWQAWCLCGEEACLCLPWGMIVTVVVSNKARLWYHSISVPCVPVYQPNPQCTVRAVWWTTSWRWLSSLAPATRWATQSPWRRHMNTSLVWCSWTTGVVSGAEKKWHCSARGIVKAGITLCVGSANARRRYNVTSSLIGWAHAQNDS